MSGNKRKYVHYATPEKLDQVNPKNKRHIKNYFNSKAMTLSDSTKYSYESDFNQWLVFILEEYDNQDLMSFDAEEISEMLEAFVAFCRDTLGNNERRIQRRLSCISSFFKLLRKKRKMTEDPMEYIERPKVRKDEKLQVKQTYLTEEQIAMIRSGLKKEGNLQLELFFEFGLSTMARANAISNIRIEQINFEEKEVNGVLEKEGKTVDLFPSEYTFELIKKWLAYRKKEKIESEYLFITKYKGEWKKVEKGTLQGSWIKKIGAMINIPELHCHDLRHSGSNLKYQMGMPLEEVSALLNHSGTQVTQDHYIKRNNKKLKESNKKFEI